MEVVYFKIAQRRSNANGKPSIGCFYVPEEAVILYKRDHVYSLTDTPQLLTRTKEIIDGRMLNTTDVTISDIRRFEYNDDKLTKLIRDLRSKTRLERDVRFGIENLFLKIVQ